MQNKMLAQFIGKEIQIYPGDTCKKYGILLDADENGILVKITRASKNQSTYKEGNIYFISFSARLAFRVVEDEE